MAWTYQVEYRLGTRGGRVTRTYGGVRALLAIGFDLMLGLVFGAIGLVFRAIGRVWTLWLALEPAPAHRDRGPGHPRGIGRFLTAAIMLPWRSTRPAPEGSRPSRRGSRSTTCEAGCPVAGLRSSPWPLGLAAGPAASPVADRLPRRGGRGRRVVPVRGRLAGAARPARDHGRRRRPDRRRRRRPARPLLLQRRADRRRGRAGPTRPAGSTGTTATARSPTRPTGADAPGPSYAMGAAVGDFDGDGRDDLFVTGWRDQRLYRNVGGGRFEDVTDAGGLGSNLWSTSAAFADLDGDGDLDLYVATYLDYDPAAAPFCAAPDGRRDYCGPEDFPAQPDRLYRNNGDGTFTDVSKSAGIDLPGRPGAGRRRRRPGRRPPARHLRRQRRHRLLAVREPGRPPVRGGRPGGRGRPRRPGRAARRDGRRPSATSTATAGPTSS